MDRRRIRSRLAGSQGKVRPAREPQREALPGRTGPYEYCACLTARLVWTRRKAEVVAGTTAAFPVRPPASAMIKPAGFPSQTVGAFGLSTTFRGYRPEAARMVRCFHFICDDGLISCRAHSFPHVVELAIVHAPDEPAAAGAYLKIDALHHFIGVRVREAFGPRIVMARHKEHLDQSAARCTARATLIRAACRAGGQM